MTTLLNIVMLEGNGVFTSKKILRMAEAEFISELLLAMHEGIRASSKQVIDNAYRDYDDDFPNRELHEKRFRETMDAIGQIFGDELEEGEFRAPRLFYPLFCAIYHFKFGLPELDVARTPIRAGDYPKARIALEGVDGLIEKVKTAEAEHEELTLPTEQRRFYSAFDVHWVHAEERPILAGYICKQLLKTLKG